MDFLEHFIPNNDRLMKKFCSRSYLNLFRKLCVSYTIRWSRDIYIEHITGHRQYDLAAVNAELTSSRPTEPEEEPTY
ncbi:hypothetical protein HNY73_001555 [Argiope bruennichi]|uniref:Uncharacterized protein n=1 Tax=Argiope bruennichi TaxID=94029 RepID=A0A8T0G595_ARGBR|nr:hypothetical protein HNY73_001555 [Argiope bruennichi]